LARIHQAAEQPNRVRPLVGRPSQRLRRPSNPTRTLCCGGAQAGGTRGGTLLRLASNGRLAMRA